MAANVRRRCGGVLVPSLLLVLLTQSSRVIGVSKVVIISGHKVPNLKRLGHIFLLHTFLTASMVTFIRAFVMKKGIVVLNIVIQDI